MFAFNVPHYSLGPYGSLFTSLPGKRFHAKKNPAFCAEFLRYSFRLSIPVLTKLYVRKNICHTLLHKFVWDKKELEMGIGKNWPAWIFRKIDWEKYLRKKRLQNPDFLANSGVHEVKTEIFEHNFARSLRNYSQNAKILEDLIQKSTLAKLFLYTKLNLSGI